MSVISTHEYRKIYTRGLPPVDTERIESRTFLAKVYTNRLSKKFLARHRRCDVYCGARETVGGSSVSSGCWGEDSNHEYGWARRTPTYVAPIRFLLCDSFNKRFNKVPAPVSGPFLVKIKEHCKAVPATSSHHLIDKNRRGSCLLCGQKNRIATTHPERVN